MWFNEMLDASPGREKEDQTMSMPKQCWRYGDVLPDFHLALKGDFVL